jgi:hypothetical protein
MGRLRKATSRLGKQSKSRRQVRTEIEQAKAETRMMLSG